jgi:hypothetical protein
MNAPSPLKEKKSLIGRIPSQRSQSIIPRSCHHSLRQRQPLGFPCQIGRCHTRFSITISYRMHHLRNSQYQCYHLRSIVRHGRGVPHHCPTKQRIYLHPRNLSRGRFQSNQSMHLRIAGSTSSTPSLEDPTNQYLRRRGNEKSTFKLSVM